MKKFTYANYTDTLRSIPQVIAHLENLDKELLGTDLENLRAFNHTYLIISRNVAKMFGTGYFTYDSVLKKLDVRFAYYYFHALNSYVLHRKTTSAWKELFDSCKTNDLYQSMYMALGVNAHVINDLGFALYDTVVDEQFYEDYIKINEIFTASIAEVIESLKEASPSIEKMKEKLFICYSIALLFLIRNWREKAWKNFKLLRNNPDAGVVISEFAAEYAVTLRSIRHLVHFYRFIKLLTF